MRHRHVILGMIGHGREGVRHNLVGVGRAPQGGSWSHSRRHLGGMMVVVATIIPQSGSMSRRRRRRLSRRVGVDALCVVHL